MTEIIQWFKSIDDIRWAIYSLNILVILDIVLRMNRKFKEKRFIKYLEENRSEHCEHSFKIVEVKDNSIDPVCRYCDKTLSELSPCPDLNRKNMIERHKTFTS